MYDFMLVVTSTHLLLSYEKKLILQSIHTHTKEMDWNKRAMIVR